jgi:hypothetical protein
MSLNRQPDHEHLQRTLANDSTSRGNKDESNYAFIERLTKYCTLPLDVVSSDQRTGIGRRTRRSTEDVGINRVFWHGAPREPPIDTALHAMI